MSITILIPFHGDSKQVNKAISSVLLQKNPNWEILILPDKPLRGWIGHLGHWCDIDDRIRRINPYSNERMYALRNINRGIYHAGSEFIGIIDGDDYLNRDDALLHVLSAFDDGAGIVWTDHEWEHGPNCSGPYMEGHNPYRHPWVTSHFRCFRRDLYLQVPKANFQDNDGQWFKRTYDQALMLPMIHLAQKEGLELEHIPLNCYTYTGQFEKGGDAHQYQMRLERLIRDRGYLYED